MTFNNRNKSINNKYFVGLRVNSSTNVDANNPVPYEVYAGTSGHGITVSNGVISLPEGEFIVEFSILAEYNVTFGAKIYKDNAEVADAPDILQHLSDGLTTSMLTSAYPFSGNCDIELRVTQDVHPVSIYSDCLIVRLD